MSERENKKPELKPEVRIDGQLYRLRFVLWAMEQVEEEFGGMREAFQAMTAGNGMVKTIRSLFRILANCQRNYDGQPEDITGEEIRKHESMAKLQEISGAIEAAINISMKGETMDGGEASDKKANPLDKEYNEKIV